MQMSQVKIAWVNREISDRWLLDTGADLLCFEARLTLESPCDGHPENAFL